MSDLTKLLSNLAILDDLAAAVHKLADLASSDVRHAPDQLRDDLSRIVGRSIQITDLATTIRESLPDGF